VETRRPRDAQRAGLCVARRRPVGRPVEGAEAEMHLAVGEPGREVFEFTVASADQLAEAEAGAFVSHVLVLKEFSWGVIRERLEKLLRHTESCANWEDAIRVLAGYLRWSDVP